MVVGVILAAGRAKRMGEIPKWALPIPIEGRCSSFVEAAYNLLNNISNEVFVVTLKSKKKFLGDLPAITVEEKLSTFTKYGQTLKKVVLSDVLSNHEKVIWMMGDHYIQPNIFGTVDLLEGDAFNIAVDSKPTIALPEAHSMFKADSTVLTKNTHWQYGKNLPEWTHLDMGIFSAPYRKLKGILAKREDDFDTYHLITAALRENLKVVLKDVKGKVPWWGANTPLEYVNGISNLSGIIKE